MEFGVFLLMQSPAGLPAQEIYARAIEIAELAEELGFAKVWVAEHHFLNYSYSSRPLVFLSHLAARTRRIRLGTAILPLSLHHPLVVAEELAMLDMLSGGRLEIGIGKGYQKYQFDRLSVDVDNAPLRYEESLEIIPLALQGREFSYDGKAFKIPPTRIFPQPTQYPIPRWMVGNTTKRETIADAIGRGANLFTGGLERMSKFINVREQYPDLFANAGRHVRVGTQRPTFVTDSHDEAIRAAHEGLWHARVSKALRENRENIVEGIVEEIPLPVEPSGDFIVRELMVAGTPEQCISQLRKIEAGLGADYYNCSVGIGDLPQEMIVKSLRRFAAEVMPAFAAPAVARAG